MFPPWWPGMPTIMFWLAIVFLDSRILESVWDNICGPPTIYCFLHPYIITVLILPSSNQYTCLYFFWDQGRHYIFCTLFKLRTNDNQCLLEKNFLSIIEASLETGQSSVSAWKKIKSSSSGFNNKWHSHLGVEAHTETIVVAVIGWILHEVKIGQLGLRIADIGVVNPATSHMSRALDQLLESQVR